MKPKRWERLEEILCKALERPIEDRAAWVRRACGDDEELAQEALELLKYDDAALGRLAFRTRDAGATQALSPGDKVAEYRVVRHIATGGMGEVYEAEQDTPVRRTVALKLVQAPLVRPEVLARFDAERRALAMMNHVNVAQVFQVGSTAGGTPFVAMEYVEGRTLLDHCDAAALDIRRRLDLFRQVCRGVQHAHRRGVIHRDLKPSNILVAEVDGEACPKIIDFGISRITSDARATTLTELGQVVGTPEYLSPEQATAGRRDIDTRADVYALGVLLYELLTGLRPFDLSEAVLYEVLRVICEVEAPRPSRRLEKSGRRAEAAAERRGTTARFLIQEIQGDLDWIAIKALAKDREGRYDSPLELAGDVERYLHQLPVSARRATASYLAGKFVRRHRGAVAAGIALAIAIVGGLAGTTLGMLKARAAQTTAQEEADRALAVSGYLAEVLFEPQVIVVRERDLDELAEMAGGGDGLEPLVGSITADQVLYFEPRKSRWGFLPRIDPVSSGHLDRHIARIDELLGDSPEMHAKLLRTLSIAYLRQGLEERSRSLLERALQIQRDSLGRQHVEVARTLGRLSRYGSVEEGRARIEEALTIREQTLGWDHAETARNLLALGWTYWRNASEGLHYFEDALSRVATRYGDESVEYARALREQGAYLASFLQHERAAPLLQRARDIEESLDAARSARSARFEGSQSLVRSLRGIGEHGRADKLEHSWLEKAIADESDHRSVRPVPEVLDARGAFLFETVNAGAVPLVDLQETVASRGARSFSSGRGLLNPGEAAGGLAGGFGQSVLRVRAKDEEGEVYFAEREVPAGFKGAAELSLEPGSGLEIRFRSSSVDFSLGTSGAPR